jgi:hypothetical protein
MDVPPAVPGPAPSGRTLESLDVDLGWFGDGEGRDQGPKVPMGAKNLFLLAARECWRDGRIDARDNELLKRLQQALHLPAPVAARLFQVAQTEHQENRLPPNEELDRAKLFRKAYRLASRDGRPARAHALLHRLGAALRIKAGTLRQALIKAASMVTGDRSDPQGEPLREVEETPAEVLASSPPASESSREAALQTTPETGPEAASTPPGDAALEVPAQALASSGGSQRESCSTWKNRRGQPILPKRPTPRKLEPDPGQTRIRYLAAGLLLLSAAYLVVM